MVVASFPVRQPFEGLIVSHVFVDAPGVDCRHRVAEAAGSAFLEAGGELNLHLVGRFELTFNEHVELVAVVLGHDTFVFLIRNRCIGVSLGCTSGHRHVVFLQKTCLQEFAHIVVGLFAHSQRSAPSATAGILHVEALGARSVAALNLWHACGVRHLEHGIGSYLHLAFLSALGHYHNNAVCSFLAV